ncbi:hypothetical protein ESA94_15985 [Lacibacter luteus]|uniref:Uncharacterized protein n=1 Tax=Lacibacter luteus TaxID=2508719 RepID=A0A4Q1CFS9_9BACT|nr:hypothetical protein [Lacibacter luteus]RXK58886.1 hypothetical protein ESA94_15985 [Lacibacter luteus]
MYIKTNQLIKSLFAVMFIVAISFTSCNNEGEKPESKDSVAAPVTEPTPAAPDSTAKDSGGMDSGEVKPVVPTQPK